MKSTTKMTSLESRVKNIIDDRLFKAYWDAVSHFKTKDLVLYYDENEEFDPVKAHTRKSLISDPEIPADLKSKISKSADEFAVKLKNNDGAFWLIVAFSDGEFTHVAINAKFIASRGNA